MKRLPDSYFERVYREQDDPWGFASSWYEQRKYALTVAALPRSHYDCIFEPGCAIGVLSALLATRCDRLIASEPFPRVADCARRRLQEHPHATVITAAIPEFWPDVRCDLLVFSEVLYYVTDEGLLEVEAAIARSTTRGAQLVAVHYSGETDYPQTSQSVHAFLRAMPGWRALVHHEEPRFVMDVLERGERD